MTIVRRYIILAETTKVTLWRLMLWSNALLPCIYVNVLKQTVHKRAHVKNDNVTTR